MNDSFSPGKLSLVLAILTETIDRERRNAFYALLNLSTALTFKQLDLGSHRGNAWPRGIPPIVWNLYSLTRSIIAASAL